MSFSTPGWTWTNTGTQSSTLNETVGETQQSMPDLATGTPVVFTTQTALEQTTSATELGHSATVLRTSTGSSTQGNSWGGTSTEGTYSSPGLSGISMRAHALVPVGSDGLSYAMNNNPTNYVGDYLWTANDLLGGGSSAAPEAQGFSRNFDTSLTTQKTLAATPGSSTTNSDHAASTGSGSNGGTTSYGTGSGGSTDYGPDLPPGHVESRAGLHFIQTTGMIIAAGDDAASKALVNAIAIAQAPLIVCDGNSCVEIVYHDLTTGRESSDPSALVPGGHWSVNVQTAAGTGGYFSVPPAERANKIDSALRKATLDALAEGDQSAREVVEAMKEEWVGAENRIKPTVSNVVINGVKLRKEVSVKTYFRTRVYGLPFIGYEEPFGSEVIQTNYYDSSGRLVVDPEAPTRIGFDDTVFEGQRLRETASHSRSNMAGQAYRTGLLVVGVGVVASQFTPGPEDIIIDGALAAGAGELALAAGRSGLKIAFDKAQGVFRYFRSGPGDKLVEVAEKEAKDALGKNANELIEKFKKGEDGAQSKNFAAEQAKDCVLDKATGQLHHAISTKVGRAIDKHKNLSGAFKKRDPRFVTRAADDAAHRGYQRWHRDIDDEVVKWLESDRNKDATAEDFLAWLRSRYQQPDLKPRFPNGF